MAENDNNGVPFDRAMRKLTTGVPPEATVRAVARGMCRAHGFDPDDLVESETVTALVGIKGLSPRWATFVPAATDFLGAFAVVELIKIGQTPE